MLSPDARAVAIDLLRPPAGYRLDCAVLTTYGLDLEALLALPLAVLAHADGGIEELLADPLLVLEALREAGERVHVFVDAAAIAVPRSARPLYAALEPSVHPVRAPAGGAFHPKVWLARFVDADAAPLLRVAVLSRNLTYDRSWDVALASEGRPVGRRVVPESRELAELVRGLPGMSTGGVPVPDSVRAMVEQLEDEIRRTAFPAPSGFSSPVRFHALGLRRRPGAPWRPREAGGAVLAIAPFASRTALDTLAADITGERTLVSRQETLDALPVAALAPWSDVRVLTDAAADEVDDEQSARPSGLHAKVIAIEHGWDVTWFVGSANLTAAAFTGRNVELMASITGRKGRASGNSGSGIARFRETGFLDRMCEPYRRTEPTPDPERAAAEAALRRVSASLASAALRVRCTEHGDGWSWWIEGSAELPGGVEAAYWPVTLAEEHARPLAAGDPWTLPTARLTAFVALRLRVPGAGADDVRMVLKMPADGLPEGRLAQILRTLVDSPERLLRFLRALLGGLEALAGEVLAGNDDAGSVTGAWGAGIGDESLLEDLVRAAARDPERLEPVRRLIADLRSTEEGRRIVPDDLYAVWRVVDEAVGPGAGR